MSLLDRFVSKPAGPNQTSPLASPEDIQRLQELRNASALRSAAQQAVSSSLMPEKGNEFGYIADFHANTAHDQARHQTGEVPVVPQPAEVADFEAQQPPEAPQE